MLGRCPKDGICKLTITFLVEQRMSTINFQNPVSCIVIVTYNTYYRALVTRWRTMDDDIL